jgi:hypothetical protein
MQRRTKQIAMKFRQAIENKPPHEPGAMGLFVSKKYQGRRVIAARLKSFV